MIRRLILTVALVLCAASPAAAVSVQAVVADSHAFLEATLDVELPDRPVMPGPVAVLEECGGLRGSDAVYANGCAGLAYPDRLLIDPEAWSRVKAWRPWARDEFPPNADLYAIAHEQLHTLQANRDLEHAAIEAFLADVWPAWSVAVVGERLPLPTSRYPEELALSRRASVLATGAPWRSRSARLWRRALAAGDNATREAMVAAAFGAAS